MLSIIKGLDCSVPKCSPGCSEDYGYCEVKNNNIRTIFFILKLIDVGLNNVKQETLLI